jgi:hypothetical protein
MQTPRIIRDAIPGVNGKHRGYRARADRRRVGDPTVAIATIGPPNDPRPAGENLWITRRQPEYGEGAVNGLASGRTPAGHIDAGDVGAIDGVIDNFSPDDQAALCSTKVFGIIKLFERRPRLSTAAAPL